MAWNVLGLYFLVLGTTGIVNAAIYFRDNEWNKIVDDFWKAPRNYRRPYEPLFLKYRRLAYLNDMYKSPDYEIGTRNEVLPRPLNLPKVNFENHRLNQMRISKPNPCVVVKITSEDDSNLVRNEINSLKLAAQNHANSNIKSSVINKEENFVHHVKKTPLDKLKSPIQSNDELDSHVSSTPSAVSPTELKLQSSDTDMQNDSVVFSSSESSSDDISSSTILNSDASPITSQETNENNESSFSTLIHENTLTVDENTMSTTGQKISSMQTQNSKDEDLSTTALYTTSDENTASSTSDLDIVTNNKTPLVDISSSQHPTAGSPFSRVSSDSPVPTAHLTETPKTEETTDPSSGEIQSTSTEIAQKESTINHISSTANEDSLTSKVQKETTEDISSTLSWTESTPSKSDFITEIISEDHVITIDTIRTARVIVSVVFLVISLIAVAVIAVYIFRVRRREVQYDQLMLLPD